MLILIVAFIAGGCVVAHFFSTQKAEPLERFYKNISNALIDIIIKILAITSSSFARFKRTVIPVNFSDYLVQSFG